MGIILRTVGVVCVASACATVPAGCQAELMPSPTVFVDSGIDPFRETPLPNRTTTSKVFYATDRTPRENPSSPENTYTNDRDFGLRLGVASVDKAPGMDCRRTNEGATPVHVHANPEPSDRTTPMLVIPPRMAYRPRVIPVRNPASCTPPTTRSRR